MWSSPVPPSLCVRTVLLGPGVGIERDAPAFRGKPQDEGYGDRAGCKGDHYSGNDHSLGNWVEGKSGSRPTPRNNAED